MTSGLQEMLAFAAVGGAALWLAITWWTRRTGASCEGCSPRSIASRTRSRGVRPAALRVLR